MKITWFGHSAFRIDHGPLAILIDPFLTGNPGFKGDAAGAANGATHVLVTHGHDDHVGDAVRICQSTGAMLVANFEICMHLVSKGVPQKAINPGNQGGTVDCGGFTTTFVKAEHSSSSQTGGGGNIYLGNPLGLVLHFAGAPTIYHMGDTDIFSDMALIADLHRPQIGMVPIGDRFTFGGAIAALACRRYFDFETIFPCHYASFGLLDQDASKFIAAMEGDAAKVRLPKPGEAVEV
jgi:L-ascorbate metabolism protein UlaG (beta-lactamase superfamily)